MIVHQQSDRLGITRALDLASLDGLAPPEYDGIGSGVGFGLGDLYPAGVVANRFRADIGGAVGHNGGGVGFANLVGRKIHAGHHERDLELEAIDSTELGRGFTILAVRVDNQARQVGRQEYQVVQRRDVLDAERIIAVFQPALQDTGLDLGVLRVDARHRENRLAAGHGIVGRTGFGVAAKTACRFELRFVGGVGRFDFRELDRDLAEAMEFLMNSRVDFPGRIVTNWYVPGAVRRAIGQGIFVTFEICLHIVGRAVALVHRFDDGRTAEGAVARGEYLRILGYHALEAGLDAVPVHQAALRELIAFGLLADRGNHETAFDFMLRARDIDRPPTTVFVRLSHFGAHAAQRLAVDNLDRLGVIDNLDTLVDRALQFLASRRHRLVVTPVNDLDVLDAGQPFGDATGVHRDVAAADHQHGFRQGRPSAGVDVVEETHPVLDEGLGLARNPHRLADKGADRQQHRRVLLLQLVQRNLVAERGIGVNLDAGAVRGHAVDILLHRFLGQTKARNAPEHHAAELIGGLVDVHLVAGLGEIVRRGQPGGNANPGPNESST